MEGLLFVAWAPKDCRVKATPLFLAVVFLLNLNARRIVAAAERISEGSKIENGVKDLRRGSCGDGVQKGSVQILAIRGSAKVSRDKGAHWSVAKVGDRLRANEALLTATNTTVDVRFKNVGGVRLAAGTELRVDKFDFVDEVQELQLDLRAGRVVVLSERLSRTSKFETRTTLGVVGVREEPAGFDINSMGLVRCMWGSLVEVFIVNGVMISPAILGPGFKTALPQPGSYPKESTAKLEAQEKQELAAELESLRQSMLNPAPVLVEGEKGRGIRRTKGNP